MFASLGGTNCGARTQVVFFTAVRPSASIRLPDGQTRRSASTF